MTINGLEITRLKKFHNEKGDIYHALKASENSFKQFGEAYFSTVNFGDIKGWKKHTLMVLNIIVPVGAIKFVVYDDRAESTSQGLFQELIIAPGNYCRLTVPPNVWMAFQGIYNSNVLLNIASIEHNPSECISLPLDQFAYDWSGT